MRLLCVCLWLSLLIGTSPAAAQYNRGPCRFWADDLSLELPQPWMQPELPCLELMVEDAAAGELAFTALAAAPDGTVFATRPYTGEVFAFTDGDGDGLPDTSRLIADELTLPNGLVYAGDALYISAGDSVWRWQQGAAAARIIDDLPTGVGVPTGVGAWTGGIAVAGDAIYVAVGAGQGEIWRYAPAESASDSLPSDALAGDTFARDTFARGLREPADLLVLDGALLALDAAGDALYRLPLDLVADSAYCLGAPSIPEAAPGSPEAAPDRPEAAPAAGLDAACIAMAPVFTFPLGSQPLGLAFYPGDAMPSLTGRLLVTLGGSSGRVDLQGYALMALSPDLTSAETLMPSAPEATGAFATFDTLRINQYGAGFFPHRPLDTTVTPSGGVLISVGGGRILSIRAFFDLY